MPAGGEDVGEEDEVFLEFVALGEGKAVEIGVWDSDVLY